MLITESSKKKFQYGYWSWDFFNLCWYLCLPVCFDQFIFFLHIIFEIHFKNLQIELPSCFLFSNHIFATTFTLNLMAYHPSLITMIILSCVTNFCFLILCWTKKNYNVCSINYSSMFDFCFKIEVLAVS